MITVKCIFCSELVEIEGKLALKQLIRCPQCQQTMEVVWLFPPELIPGKPPEFQARASTDQDVS